MMTLGSVERRAPARPPEHLTPLPTNAGSGRSYATNATERGSRWYRKLASCWSSVAEQLFSLPPERLIALSRLTFSAFALLAIVLDPTRPTRNIHEIRAVLVAYIIYAGFLAIMPARAAVSARLHHLTHCIDIIVLSVLCVFSGELSSPFWAFVGFVLIASAIRWGFAGVLATAFLLIALFTAIGWPYYDPRKSDLNGLIMRSAYALVAAVMLGYFASYRDRSRSRLARLAAWPIESAADENDPSLDVSLRHASDVLGGLRLLVLWNEGEEPNGRIAYWDGDNCTLLDVVSHTLAPRGNSQSAQFHHEPIRDAARLPDAISFQLGLERLEIAHGKAVCCSAPFATQRYRGQVFVINPGHPSEDMLSLTEIVAGRIAFELEQFALLRELAAAAGWRERGRLARDLHDSVLQDLTAAGLQLKIASQQNLETTRASLGVIGKMLQQQQTRIRRFVEDAHARPDGTPQFLKEQLESFSQALSSQWTCLIGVAVDPPDIRVPNSMLATLCQIISEATANAVRHGQADRVDVVITAAPAGLSVSISDTGTGPAVLQTKSDFWPHSIRSRVADLGGEFQFDPSRPGLAMRIVLPQ